MTTLAFDTHKFVKELTAAGMKTVQTEVLASSYASLLTDRIATNGDLKALGDRLNARIAYAQLASVVALSEVIVLDAFLGG